MVITTISLLAALGRWLPIGSATSEIVLILGMAVGVDYSLFYLRREREERAAGRSFGEALRIAAATSGRAIVISGVTVMISLAGLFLTGVDLFTGMAFGTIIVVGVAVAGGAHAAARGAGPDRRVGGPLPDPGAGPAPDRGPAVAAVGRAGAPGRAPPASSSAARPRWPCWRWPRPRPACGSAARRSTCRTTCRSCRPWTGSPPRSPAGRPRPRSWSPAATWNSPAVRRALTALEHQASARGPLRDPVTVSPVAHGRALIV